MTRLASILLLCICIAGCSSAGPPAPTLFGVSGILTQGDKPIPDVSVQLVPEDPSSAILPASGITGTDGKFTVSTNGKLGAMKGKYKVVLMMATTKPQTMQDLEKLSGAGVKTGGMPKTKTPFPESWTRPETSPMQHEVVDKSTTVDIKL